MPRLNYKFIAIGFVALLLCAGAAHALHYVQMQRHSIAYLREARRNAAEKQFKEAVNYYQRYVVIAPSDAEASIEFGELLVQVGALDRAYLVLEQALRHDPSRADVRKQLADIAIKLGRFADAERHVALLLETSPEDGELWFYRSRGQIGQADYNAAFASLQEATKLSPERVDFYESAAALLTTRLERPDEAQRILDAMVEANSGNYQAYLARGRWHLRNARTLMSSDAPDAEEALSNTLAQAESDASKAIELSADAPETILFGIELALQNKKFDEAARLVQRGLKLHPTNSDLYRSSANLQVQIGRPDAAVAELRKGISAVPTDLTLQWTLANLLVEMENFPAAEQVIRSLRSFNYPDAPLALLEARILVGKKEWRIAAKQLEAQRNRLVQWPELAKQTDWFLGKCYEQLGRPDQQLAAYRRAAGTNFDWIPARVALANALLATNQTEQALQEYARLSRMATVPVEVLANYARILIAIASSDSEIEPSEIRQIEGVIKKIEGSPGRGFAPVLQAELLVSLNESEKALELLQQARNQYPDQVELWTAQATLASRLEEWTLVEQTLNEADKKFGFKPALVVNRGRYLVQRYGEEASSELRKVSAKVLENSAPEVAEVTEYLATLAYWIQDFALAKELGTFAAGKQPDRLRTQLLLLEVAFKADDAEAMDKRLEEVRRIDGESALWNYGKAVRLVLAAKESNDTALLQSAQQHLVAAEQLRPTWGRIAVLSGQIHERLGNIEVAIRKYEEATDQGESDPAIVKHVIALLFEQQRYTDVDRLVRKLSNTQSLFSDELNYLASQAALQIGEPGRALELARNVAEKSKRYQDHMWLGNVLSVSGKIDDAEKELRLAIELAPAGTPEPWVALVRMLARSGKQSVAEKVVKDAEKQLSEGEGALALAECYELIQQTDLARQWYEKATTSSADPALRAKVAGYYLRSGAHTEAETELKLIVDENKDQDQVRWARRNLALLTSARPGKDSLDQALAMLDQNLADGKLPAGDLQVKAAILASQPAKEVQLQAISLIEAIPEQNRRPQDEFILAKLYQRHRDWPAARQKLQSLAARSHNQPDIANEQQVLYLGEYIAGLLSHGEESEAALWLDRLKEVAPNEALTAELDANLQVRRENAESAADALTKWASSNDRDQAWLGARLEQLANLAKSLKGSSGADYLLAQAESAFRTYSESEAADPLQLGEFYGRNERHDEALAVFEEHVSDADPDKFANAASHLMIQPEVSAANLQKLQELLGSALAKHGRQHALLVAAADLFSWRADYAAAERHYREALEQKPDDVRTLNNLALALVYASRPAQESLELLNRAISATGADGVLLDSRGWVHLAAGEPQKAVEDFRAAINWHATPDRHFHLAVALQRSGDRKAAEAAFGEAVKLGIADSGLHPAERDVLKQMNSTFGHTAGS